MAYNLRFIILAVSAVFHGTTAISSDYVYYSGVGLYRHVSELTAWGDAFEDCKQSGGHLLIINSEEELQTFEYIAEQQTEKYDLYWVGLTDLYKTGHFYDIKGNTLNETGYVVNWGPDRPLTIEGYNCLEMWNSSSGWGLANVPCTQTDRYICEVDFC